MKVINAYSVPEAARLLSVTPQTVLNWRERGWINVLKLPNGRYRIPADEIERLNRPQLLQAEGGQDQ